MNKENFKIGDLVEIKQWNEMAKEFGLIFNNDTINVDGYFVKEMKNLCGKRFKIKYIFGNSKVEGLDCEYKISTDMIRKVDPNKKEYQCTGEIEFILSDSNGNKVLYCPCKLESVKSKPDLKISQDFEISQEEFNKALEKIRNIELPHDLHKMIKESSKELKHSKYKVILGTFKGFTGEIVDSNENEIGLRNEDGEKCYVKRDSVERVRMNYIDEPKYEEKQKDNEIICIDAFENKIEVEIKDLRHEHYFFGSAICKEGSKYDYKKGCEIAICKARVEECIFHIEEAMNCYMNKTLKPVYLPEELRFMILQNKLIQYSNELKNLRYRLEELCK